MFYYTWLNLIRNMKKNILLSLITIFLVLFLVNYEHTLLKTKADLEYIYDTTIVSASFIPKQEGIPIEVHYTLIKKILDTGFVESYNALDYITGSSVSPQVYFPIGIPEEDYPKLIGVTPESLKLFTGNHLNYIENYTDTIWNGTNRLCAVSKQIMEQFDIEYGDNIQLGALMFEVGLWDESIKKNTYKVVASFEGLDRTMEHESGKNPLSVLSSLDIVLPFESYISDMRYFYNNKLPELLLNEYMSIEEVTFVLKDNRNLWQLRSMINKMPFRKDVSYSIDSIYFNIDFEIQDEELIYRITPLHNTIYMMENSRLIIYGLIGIIGIIISYLIYQSYKNEKAIMLMLGQSRGETYLSLLGYMIIAPFMTATVLYIVSILSNQESNMIIHGYFLTSYLLGFHIAFAIDTWKKG